MIPQDILDQILDKTDIVDVISGYIPLKQTGRNFKASCPFHHEKTPSFVVSPDKKIFRCFGCGESGNVFGFLMKHDRLEFLEAVKVLADKAGISLPQQRASASPAQQKVAASISSANQIASSFYHYSLIRTDYGKRALGYLKQRGIKEQTVAELKLGFAPDSWDGLIKHAKVKGAGPNALEKAGLVLPGRSGSHYDRFRNRIIFPIFNAKGSVVGFGARVLDKSMPKYVNSPDTPAFRKGSNLYGLNFSTAHIKVKDMAVIVEGYLDFLTLYEAGIKNVVAALGTSLTVEQIRLLKRYSKNLTMVFDADQAGEQASLRGLDLAVAEGMTVKVVTLPKGYDPDNFTRQKGAKAMMDAIAAAPGLFDYKLGILTSQFKKNTPEGKAKIAQQMLPTISRMPSAILKSEYIKKLSEGLHIGEAVLRTELKKVKSDYSYAPKNLGTPNRHTLGPAERMLLGLLLEDVQLIEYAKAKIGLETIEDENFKMLLGAIFDLHGKGSSVNAGKLMSLIEDEFLCQAVSQACISHITVSDKKKTFHDCLEKMEKACFNKRLLDLQSQIKAAQEARDEKAISKLISEYSKLIKIKRSPVSEKV